MASHESDDEFGDGQSFEYNEAFESQLRVIESQQPIFPERLFGPPVTFPNDPSADRASATRRKLEHLEISLETEATDNELVDGLIGEEDQELLDVLNISGSQASKYEEELVQQVAQLIPGAVHSSTSVVQTQLGSKATKNGSIQEISLETTMGGVASGTRKRSLFEKFRKRGFFSVTDLVAPSWCEVQTSTGAVIVLNKEIAGTGEKIMRKGEQVHKKLEREIHPVEVEVKTDSREDVWGLRFLNMLASLEALMTLGKCRELPVVGFVRGYLLVGVIDEITRKPLVTYTKNKSLTSLSQPRTEKSTVLQPSDHREEKTQSTKSVKSPSKRTEKGKSSDPPRSSPQKTLFAFYRPLGSRPAPTSTFSHDRTHVLYVSDSKTRAGGTMPKEENSTNGKMQLMLYKEMLDGMIVEGLRQYAREQKTEQSGESDSSDEFQVVDAKLDAEIICIDTDGNEAAASRSKAMSPRRERKSGGVVSSSTGSAIDPFTWPALFDHLALDATEPFTETFLAQSRPLIGGNSLSATVSGARNLQQMTSCWAEYVSKLGLGTIDPKLNDVGIEQALNKETVGRKMGRSEKLLSLVYRRIGKSSKKKLRQARSGTDSGQVREGDKGKKRRRRRNAKEDDIVASPDLPTEGLEAGEVVTAEPTDSTPTQSSSAMEVEEERTLQLAIAESLNITPGISAEDTGASSSRMNATQPKALADDEEPLLESLLPRERRIEAGTPYPPESGPSHSQPLDIMEPPPFIDSDHATSSSTGVIATPDADGSIIGSHRFAYSSTLLTEHIERILQFWTGAREPTGVTIENTSRCGWCEFEDGCEWRAAKAMEAISKNEALKSARRPAAP
ncbi:hypothetical protein QFC21_005197 [Naganishia friedmannii]|uniref:Uncharacterized protein n=1 Tax=Naganishia friedmannii TaxID=89922 RepID=A0ACC2VBR8_9TREE|nr:hypothetical protein QFC21_005197 [Naganishia friedmannii]